MSYYAFVSCFTDLRMDRICNRWNYDVNGTNRFQTVVWNIVYYVYLMVVIFTIVVITERLSIIAASILIIIPLAIRYVFYTLTNI